jgi:hypothetical protein
MFKKILKNKQGLALPERANVPFPILPVNITKHPGDDIYNKHQKTLKGTEKSHTG